LRVRPRQRQGRPRGHLHHPAERRRLVDPALGFRRPTPAARKRHHHLPGEDSIVWISFSARSRRSVLHAPSAKTGTRYNCFMSAAANLFQRLRWHLLRNSLTLLWDRSLVRMLTIVFCSALIWAGLFIVSWYAFHELKTRWNIPLDGSLLEGL